MTAPDTATFWERYRQLFNRRGEDWWSVVFGYPVARLLVVLLVPVGWVTPSLLTVVGFGVKLAAAACLWQSEPAAIWLAAALLQVAQVFDSMDGTLARARPAFSHVGGFLDKVTDGIGLYAICTAVGVHAARDTGEVHLLVLASAAGAAFLVLCYMFWVVRAAVEPDGSARNMAGGAPVIGWRDIGREWLVGWTRMFKFGEADLYLWIALLAVLDQWRILVYLLVLTQGTTAAKRFVDHLLTLRRSDAQR